MMPLRDFLFPKPTPSQSASELGRHGAAVRKAVGRANYKAFHDAMAASVGTSIKWADE